MSGPRILVAGLPRSGTTWVAEVLGRTAGARYLHEPDNHLVRPDAWWAKRRPRRLPRPAARRRLRSRPGDAAAMATLTRLRRLPAALGLAVGAGRARRRVYAGAKILQRAGALQVRTGERPAAVGTPAAPPARPRPAASARWW